MGFVYLVLRPTSSALWDIGDAARPIHTKVSFIWIGRAYTTLLKKFCKITEITLFLYLQNLSKNCTGENIPEKD